MDYILDFKPVIPEAVNEEYLIHIEKMIKEKKSLSLDDVQYYLDYISYLVRYKMCPDMQSFRNKCDLAQSILYYYFQKIGVKVLPSMTQKAITNNIVGHNFLVIELLVENNPTLLLVDPTYVQFFTATDCALDKFFINPKDSDTILITPDPGFFIRDEQMPIAEYICNHGHALLSDDVAQMYGDSFYNTKVGVSLSNWKFQSIPGQIYINSFLKGDCPLSKKEEELKNDGVYLSPIEEDLYRKF